MTKEMKIKTTAVKSLESSARIKGMVKQNILDTHNAHKEGKKVAYTFICCLYDEIIRAMDVVPVWTENYAGVCAIKHDAERFLAKAESESFSRSLCTYATCGLGFDIWREQVGEMPPDAPWGGQVRPDMMLGSGQILCDPRNKWFVAAQRYMPDVPVYQFELPWPQYEDDIDSREVEGYYVRYITEQLRGLVTFLEKQTSKKMDWDRLGYLVDLGDRTWDVWWETLELRKAVPTPMGTEDAMTTFVAGVYMLGTQESYDFWQDLYKELKYRIDNKIGLVGVPEEKYRLMWGGGLPPWFALSDFDYFKSKGAAFPVEIAYRTIEPSSHLELPRVSDPLEHLAWRWVRYWTHWYRSARKRPGSHPDVERLIRYIEDYKIDGVVMHEAFSCRTWHLGLIWQLNLLKKLHGDIPSLILESDIVDSRSYSEIETHSKIDAFIEAVASAKSKTR